MGTPTFVMNGLVALTLLAFAAAIEASPYFHPHIIRGRDAQVGEFPWQGSLQVLQRNRGPELYPGHTCGCVLVAQKWVVTAAHCVGRGAGGLYVVLGMHKRGDANVGQPQGYYIQQIMSHPGWDGAPGGTDAAMLLLQQDVAMNQYVRPIVMTSEGDDFTGQTCTISGWGITQEGIGGGSLPATLQTAQVPVMDIDDY